MDDQGNGHHHKSFMVETTAIDAFLGDTLRAVRAGESAPWPPAPDSAWTSREELTAVWERIEFHGISVLLHHHAARLANWPEKMLARIAEEARLIGLWEATHHNALSKLIDGFAQAGIETVLMKGTAVAYSLYEEPAARRRGDSDLLVRPRDLERARELLSSSGWYRNDDPVGVTFQEGWRCDVAGHFTHFLDLHWEPSDRPVLQRLLTCDDFFADPQPLPRLAENAMRADHALSLVHETLNQKWHHVHGYYAEQGKVIGSRRLIWSLDFTLIAQALAPADWDRVCTFCESRKIGQLVAEALRGAASDLSAPLPEAVLVRLEAQPLDPAVAAYFEASDDFGEFWHNLRGARSWRDRATLVLDRSFPPRSHLLTKYPDHAHWPTLLLQTRSLVGTAGRALKRVLR
jgi:hypothetical protein